MADCKVVLTADQSSRWVKILRAKEPAPVSPGLDENDKPLPVPKARTDTELIPDSMFDHISGAVLYTERQIASSSVKEF